MWHHVMAIYMDKEAMTLQEVREILIRLERASRNQEKRAKINQTLDTARRQRICFHSAHIIVERKYDGEWKVVIE
jgi:ABC-type phosphate transport system auxiliary subunit